MSGIDIPAGLSSYLAARQQQRADATAAAWGRLTEREQRLVREAAVMGYVQGVRATGEQVAIPPDKVVVRTVLDAADAFRDLYPTLAELFKAEVCVACGDVLEGDEVAWGVVRSLPARRGARMTWWQRLRYRKATR